MKNELNTICNSIQKYQIPRNKLTKGMQNPTLKTIEHWWEKLKKTFEKNGELYYVHGLQDSILLR